MYLERKVPPLFVVHNTEKGLHVIDDSGRKHIEDVEAINCLVNGWVLFLRLAVQLFAQPLS